MDDVDRGGPWRTVSGRVAALADATPSDRDRVVDAVRAASITVVVVWHVALSITQRNDAGILRNPNPIEHIPGGWLATWVGQVIPLFFVVGGFANFQAWSSTPRRGGGAVEFARRRLIRLLAPVAVFVAVWLAVTVIELALWGTEGGTLVERSPIVFTPLWFLGAYLFVVLAAPLTATWHAARPRLALAALAVPVVVVDLLGVASGIGWVRWLNLAFVWLFVHQLGYWWGDGTIGSWSRVRRLSVGVFAVFGVWALTSLEFYPRSLVATAETDISHMNPPTAVLAVLAVAQLAAVMVLHPWLSRVLGNRRPWMVVVAVNAVILTVFVWHMTALLVIIEVLEALGVTLGSEPTVQWWLTRPLWLLGTLVVLVPFLVVFARVELGGRRSRSS